MKNVLVGEKMDLLRKLHAEDMQLWRMAEILGVARSSVDRAIRRMGLPNRRTGPKDGERHPNWKGGRRLVGAYWYIYAPDHPNTTKQKYVLEHRLVLEKALERLLDPREVVHHKNGDTQDNRLENLELFQDNGAHLRETLIGLQPSWTPEGIAKMAEALEQRSIRRGAIEPGGDRRTRTIGRYQATLDNKPPELFSRVQKQLQQRARRAKTKPDPQP